MSAEWLIAGVTAVGLLAYLLYSLLRPEHF
ncbi:MAG TPA: K(+)-transporting ATPase subunit F [Gemmatimonadales bacterium]|nr:K(+)-transporting ATPase subunit F [Gemmatimonadales bacterium]